MAPHALLQNSQEVLRYGDRIYLTTTGRFLLCTSSQWHLVCATLDTLNNEGLSFEDCLLEIVSIEDARDWSASTAKVAPLLCKPAAPVLIGHSFYLRHVRSRRFLVSQLGDSQLCQFVPNVNVDNCENIFRFSSVNKYKDNNSTITNNEVVFMCCVSSGRKICVGAEVSDSGLYVALSASVMPSPWSISIYSSREHIFTRRVCSGDIVTILFQNGYLVYDNVWNPSNSNVCRPSIESFSPSPTPRAYWVVESEYLGTGVSSSYRLRHYLTSRYLSISSADMKGSSFISRVVMTDPIPMSLSPAVDRDTGCSLRGTLFAFSGTRSIHSPAHYSEFSLMFIYDSVSASVNTSVNNSDSERRPLFVVPEGLSLPNDIPLSDVISVFENLSQKIRESFPSLDYALELLWRDEPTISIQQLTEGLQLIAPNMSHMSISLVCEKLKSIYKLEQYPMTSLRTLLIPMIGCRHLVLPCDYAVLQPLTSTDFFESFTLRSLTSKLKLFLTYLLDHQGVCPMTLHETVVTALNSLTAMISQSPPQFLTGLQNLMREVGVLYYCHHILLVVHKTLKKRQYNINAANEYKPIVSGIYHLLECCIKDNRQNRSTIIKHVRFLFKQTSKCEFTASFLLEALNNNVTLIESLKVADINILIRYTTESFTKFIHLNDTSESSCDQSSQSISVIFPRLLARVCSSGGFCSVKNQNFIVSEVLEQTSSRLLFPLFCRHLGEHMVWIPFEGVWVTFPEFGVKYPFLFDFYIATLQLLRSLCDGKNVRSIYWAKGMFPLEVLAGVMLGTSTPPALCAASTDLFCTVMSLDVENQSQVIKYVRIWDDCNDDLRFKRESHKKESPFEFKMAIMPVVAAFISSLQIQEERRTRMLGRILDTAAGKIQTESINLFQLLEELLENILVNFSIENLIDGSKSQAIYSSIKLIKQIIENVSELTVSQCKSLWVVLVSSLARIVNFASTNRCGYVSYVRERYLTQSVSVTNLIIYEICEIMLVVLKIQNDFRITEIILLYKDVIGKMTPGADNFNLKAFVRHFSKAFGKVDICPVKVPFKSDSAFSFLESSKSDVSISPVSLHVSNLFNRLELYNSGNNKKSTNVLLLLFKLLTVEDPDISYVSLKVFDNISRQIRSFQSDLRQVHVLASSKAVVSFTFIMKHSKLLQKWGTLLPFDIKTEEVISGILNRFTAMCSCHTENSSNITNDDANQRLFAINDVHKIVIEDVLITAIRLIDVLPNEMIRCRVKNSCEFLIKFCSNNCNNQVLLYVHRKVFNEILFCNDEIVSSCVAKLYKCIFSNNVKLINFIDPSEIKFFINFIVSAYPRRPTLILQVLRALTEVSVSDDTIRSRPVPRNQHLITDFLLEKRDKTLDLIRGEEGLDQLCKLLAKTDNSLSHASVEAGNSHSNCLHCLDDTLLYESTKYESLLMFGENRFFYLVELLKLLVQLSSLDREAAFMRDFALLDLVKLTLACNDVLRLKIPYMQLLTLHYFKKVSVRDTVSELTIKAEGHLELLLEMLSTDIVRLVVQLSDDYSRGVLVNEYLYEAVVPLSITIMGSAVTASVAESISERCVAACARLFESLCLLARCSRAPHTEFMASSVTKIWLNGYGQYMKKSELPMQSHSAADQSGVKTSTNDVSVNGISLLDQFRVTSLELTKFPGFFEEIIQFSEMPDLMDLFDLATMQEYICQEDIYVHQFCQLCVTCSLSNLPQMLLNCFLLYLRRPDGPSEVERRSLLFKELGFTHLLVQSLSSDSPENPLLFNSAIKVALECLNSRKREEFVEKIICGFCQCSTCMMPSSPAKISSFESEFKSESQNIHCFSIIMNDDWGSYPATDAVYHRIMLFLTRMARQCQEGTSQFNNDCDFVKQEVEYRFLYNSNSDDLDSRQQIMADVYNELMRTGDDPYDLRSQIQLLRFLCLGYSNVCVFVSNLVSANIQNDQSFLFSVCHLFLSITRQWGYMCPQTHIHVVNRAIVELVTDILELLLALCVGPNWIAIDYLVNMQVLYGMRCILSLHRSYQGVPKSSILLLKRRCIEILISFLSMIDKRPSSYEHIELDRTIDGPLSQSHILLAVVADIDVYVLDLFFMDLCWDNDIEVSVELQKMAIDSNIYGRRNDRGLTKEPAFHKSATSLTVQLMLFITQIIDYSSRCYLQSNNIGLMIKKFASVSPEDLSMESIKRFCIVRNYRLKICHVEALIPSALCPNRGYRRRMTTALSQGGDMMLMSCYFHRPAIFRKYFYKSDKDDILNSLESVSPHLLTETLFTLILWKTTLIFHRRINTHKFPIITSFLNFMPIINAIWIVVVIICNAIVLFTSETNVSSISYESTLYGNTAQLCYFLQSILLATLIVRISLESYYEFYPSFQGYKFLCQLDPGRSLLYLEDFAIRNIKMLQLLCYFVFLLVSYIRGPVYMFLVFFAFVFGNIRAGILGSLIAFLVAVGFIIIVLYCWLMIFFCVYPEQIDMDGTPVTYSVATLVAIVLGNSSNYASFINLRNSSMSWGIYALLSLNSYLFRIYFGTVLFMLIQAPISYFLYRTRRFRSSLEAACVICKLPSTILDQEYGGFLNHINVNHCQWEYFALFLYVAIISYQLKHLNYKYESTIRSVSPPLDWWMKQEINHSEFDECSASDCTKRGVWSSVHNGNGRFLLCSLNPIEFYLARILDDKSFHPSMLMTLPKGSAIRVPSITSK